MRLWQSGLDLLSFDSVVGASATGLFLIELGPVLVGLGVRLVAGHDYLLLARCVVAEHQVVRTEHTVSILRVLRLDHLILRGHKTVRSC